MMFETIMMGLRMKKGINTSEFYDRFNVKLTDNYGEVIAKHIENGNLQLTDGYLVTTTKGMHILNDILVDFL